MELAHISDLHVPVPLGVEPRRRFLNKRVLGTLNLLLKRSHPRAVLEAAVADLQANLPDQLAVTGDLSNLALERELEQARDLLLQIGLPPGRISLIPGNHDAYVHDTFHAQAFERILAPLLPDHRGWPRVQRRDEVVIVGANSAFPTAWFMAYGRVGQAQLEAIDAALAEHADAPCKLILVHHPPIQGTGRPDLLIRRNLDGSRLLELAAARGVTAILCGHTHRAFRYRSGSTWVLCAGSTTQRVQALGDGATYNRYRLEEGRLVSLEVRGYDPVSGSFQHLREEQLA